MLTLTWGLLRFDVLLLKRFHKTKTFASILLDLSILVLSYAVILRDTFKLPEGSVAMVGCQHPALGNSIHSSASLPANHWRVEIGSHQNANQFKSMQISYPLRVYTPTKCVNYMLFL